MAYGIHTETGILNNITAYGDITANKVQVSPPRRIRFNFNNIKFGDYTFNWAAETLWDLNSDLDMNISSTCSNQCSGSCSSACKNSCTGSCQSTCSTTCSSRCRNSCSGGCSGEHCGSDC